LPGVFADGAGAQEFDDGQRLFGCQNIRAEEQLILASFQEVKAESRIAPESGKAGAGREVAVQVGVFTQQPVSGANVAVTGPEG
jgi:hypothetical protein